MHIMLLLMLLPIIAIPVFWLLPLGLAIPIYVFALLLSGAMFWLMRGTMRRPAVTGDGSLIGKDADVVSQSSQGISSRYIVRAEDRLWTAQSRDTLQPGETATIVAVEGNKLIINRRKANSANNLA
jgi:membrane protein implicated in regulation of membrane protease activity